MSIFAQGSFINEANATPESIALKRAQIAALMPRFGQAKYVGEGLGQLATGIGMGVAGRKLDQTEGAARKSAQERFNAILGGGMQGTAQPGGFSVLGSMPMPEPDPNSPDAIGNAAMAALGKPPADGGYRASLVGSESGGNWAASNNEVGAGGKRGHFGRVQFGHARLEDAKRAGVLPPDMTPEQFMANPEYQKAAEDWHFGDLERELAPYVGMTVNGQVLDMGALVAMGHLGGAAGARKYVESGGQYNPADSFGTSLSDYAQMHGGNGGGMMNSPQMAAATVPMEALISIISDPWAAPEQKAQAQAMLDQQTQMNDPAYRMGLRADELAIQKAQMEIDQMGQPQTPEQLTERQALAAAGGLQPGTPEYQAYMLTGEMPGASGSEDPTSVREYQFYAQQAQARGETPIPYEEFITLEAAAGNPSAGNFAQPVTPGQEQTDKAYAPEYVQWTQGGGADMASQIATIEGVADRLEAGTENLSGPGVGALPDWLGTVFAPAAVSSREDVESVVQRNLRVLLGAQFTQAEGDRLIARAYNPRLPEAENAKRLRRLAIGMKAAADARADQARYYEENGTLTGWTGKVWSPSDFERVIDEGAPTAAPEQGAAAVTDPEGFKAFAADPSAIAAAQKYGVTLEEMWAIKQGQQ